MKLLCFSSLFVFNFFSFSHAETAAFYYGKDFDKKNMARFDIITVQPDQVSAELVSENRKKLFAYISVGETGQKISKKLILAENKAWNSFIGDLRIPQYRELVKKEVEKAGNKGFVNFFLDTIDSYQAALKTKKDKETYEYALINFIKEIKQDNPGARIIMNRGFEIADKLSKEVEFIAAESLYKGINPETKEYQNMTGEQTDWLKERLNALKKNGFKIIVIDYLPPNKKKESVLAARKIKEDGFIAYICDYDLLNWGNNEYEHIERDILILYDSQKVPDMIYSQAHRIVSMPLEYLGYRPKLADINAPLPQETDNLAGIIVCPENTEAENPSVFLRWILEQIKKGKKIIFLGDFPFPKEETYFSELGIVLASNKSAPGEKIERIKEGNEFDFEIPPNYFYSSRLYQPKETAGAHIFKNSKGQLHYQAAITQWGGYALENSWINMKGNNEILAINPFIFFKKALRLKEIPVMDPTTENSRRILISHIDGDGFASAYEQDVNFYASEILEKEILSVYKIPHAVSVIRAELESPALKPSISARLKETAKKIFSLNTVEMGNHSYSHPFKWLTLKNASEYENIEQVYGLEIPGYSFNIEEEILGTKKWLEKEFSETKKKNNIFFWTGDCIAPASALRLLKNNNMLNINGGSTQITKLKPYLSNIAPLSLNREGYYQIYTGQQNENVYTNLWNGPFWGYKNAVQTFQLTDSPRRLKPINIYYHFYSASKTSSLKALKYVYEYALNQKNNPSFLSDYLRKVLDFYETEIYSHDNEFLILSGSEIKTLRIPANIYPEISKNSPVAGYSDYNKERYLNLYGQAPYKIRLISQKTQYPYLKDSNAKIEDFSVGLKEIKLSLTGYLPIEYNLANSEKCVLNEKSSNENNVYKKEIYGKCSE